MMIDTVNQALAYRDDWHGWGGGGWGPGWPGLIGLIVFVALIAAVIWFAVRGARPRERTAADRAKDVLAERYARGEINTEEYQERLDQLK